MKVKVLKFSASWCRPCKVMAPIFEKISKMDEFKDIEFLSYDIEDDDDSIELVNNFNIKNVPTFVIVDGNNNPMKKIIGAVQENELVNIIKDTIKYES